MNSDLILCYRHHTRVAPPIHLKARKRHFYGPGAVSIGLSRPLSTRMIYYITRLYGSVRLCSIPAGGLYPNVYNDTSKRKR